MTPSKGWHGATGGLRRAVAGGCVAAGIVAGLWAGPAAFASSSVPQSGSSASSAPTKYYIVPVPPKGGTESLYDIALQTLGNGARYLEIFNLNKGRLQPNGARMESPRTIDAGWILQLPADARGPGVRFGPLPVSPAAPAATSAATAAPASHRPRAAAAAPSRGGSMSFAEAIGGVLLIVVLAGLAVLLGRQPWRRAAWRARWRRAGRWAGRRGLHGRAAPAQPSGRIISGLAMRVATRIGPLPGRGPRGTGGPAVARRVAPDRPHRAAGRRGLLWAARPDKPETGHGSPPGAARRRVTEADRPSSPGAAHLGPFGPEHPSFPGAGRLGAVVSDHLTVRGPAHSGQPGPEFPSPFDAGSSGTSGPEHSGPAGPVPYGALGPEHPSFPGAGHLGTVGPERSGPAEAALAPAPYPGRDQAPGPSGRHAARQLAQRTQPGPSRALVPWNADSVRLAERMLAEADEQATRIVTTAEQAAAVISQSAAEQAAAALTAAEQEAAQLRAALGKMAAELGQVAASVLENLATPGPPSASPPSASPPSASPAIKPAARSASGPAALPAAQPAPRPGRSTPARPGTKPGVSPRRTPKPKRAATGKSRQLSAWHKMIAALVVLSLVGVAGAATEIGLHGLSFFVFRNAGAGAGNARNLNENQGPGQPDAPGPHHQAHHRPPGGPRTSK